MGKKIFDRKQFILVVVGILFLGMSVYLGFFPFYIFSIKDLSNGKTVLEDISFQVEPGETVAIVGRTGSGKSR